MSQTRLSLPIHEITIENRQRFDLGDLEDLIESLRIHGLIQPVIVNQHKRLVAGGRRIAAAVKLGWDRIDVAYRHTLSEAELHILELEENLRRKDETWQEKCLHIYTIHNLKEQLSATNSEGWGQRETGAMLGVSFSHINFNLCIARKLKDRESSYWQCESLSDAWRLWIRERQDLLAEDLAKEGLANVHIEETTAIVSPLEPDELTYHRELFYANPHNTGTFEDYWTERQGKLTEVRAVVHITKHVLQGDSIAFMNDPANAGRFDHVITDIPYAIDLKMLNQQNKNGGISELDTVEELHDVEYNLKLIADFFPAAFKVIKNRGFVVTWADQMLWQYMYDLAIKAGFAVQRWPIVWHKHQAENQCVGYNTTKDTEIAIVCRKKATTLFNQPQTSVVCCGKDELCAAIAHPFAKPYECWRFLVETFTYSGQSILEPFAGQGSGVISMLRLNRAVVGIELDKAHYNSLLENVKTLYYLRVNPAFLFK